MRDKHYPVRAFRLSDEVYQQLLELKKSTNLSHNLLFKTLLHEFKGSKEQKKQKNASLPDPNSDERDEVFNCEQNRCELPTDS